MTGIELEGARSWVLLYIDTYWQLLLVASIIVAIAAGASVAHGAELTETTIEHTGFVDLEVGPAPSSIELTDRVDIPAEGVVPSRLVDTLTVTASADRRGSAIGQLTISQTTTRATRHGTLWSVTETLQSINGTGTLETTAQVDLSAVLSAAESIDDALETHDAGHVTIDFSATVSDRERGPLATTSATVDRRGAIVLLESGSHQTISEVRTHRGSRDVGHIVAGVVGVIGSVAIGSLRGRRIIPLDDVERTDHRSRALRWRYRHRFITQTQPIELTSATHVSTPRAIVYAGERAGAPILVDERGVLSVTIDGRTYAWSGDDRLQGE